MKQPLQFHPVSFRSTSEQPPCDGCGCAALCHPTSNTGKLPAGVRPCSNCDRCTGYMVKVKTT